MFAEKDKENIYLFNREKILNRENRKKREMQQKSRSHTFVGITLSIFLAIGCLVMNNNHNERMAKRTTEQSQNILTQEELYFNENVLAKAKIWQNAPVTKTLISQALGDALQEKVLRYQMLKFVVIQSIMTEHLLSPDLDDAESDLTMDYIKDVFFVMGDHIYKNSDKFAISPEVLERHEKMSDSIAEIEKNKSSFNTVLQNIEDNFKIRQYYSILPTYLDMKDRHTYLNHYFATNMVAKKILEQENSEEHIQQIRKITKQDNIAKSELLNALKRGTSTPEELWEKHFKAGLGTEMPEWFLMLNRDKLNENISLSLTSNYLENTENMTQLFLFKPTFSDSLEKKTPVLKSEKPLTLEEEDKTLKQAKEILDRQISQMENTDKNS